MASVALQRWQRVREPALAAVEAQCAATAAGTLLADENLRGFVMLLSGHLQGFCRDLYSGCVQIAVAAAPPGLQVMIQRQSLARRQLESANPRFETICDDFDRLGLDLSAVLHMPPLLAAANAARATHVNLLNKWRNYAAHHNPLPPTGAGALTLPAVSDWKTSCGELVAELDMVMYNHLRALTGTAPW